MRALGRELGVTHGALYRYFPDLKSVLAALGAEIAEAIAPPPADLPWQEWLRQSAHALRRVMRAHPELIDPVTWSTSATAAQHMLSVGLSVLGRTFAPPDALLAIGAVTRFASGFAQMEPLFTSPDETPLSEELLEALGGAEPIVDLDVLFDRELDIIIAGIDATLAKTAPRRQGGRNPRRS